MLSVKTCLSWKKNNLQGYKYYELNSSENLQPKQISSKKNSTVDANQYSAGKPLQQSISPRKSLLPISLPQ